MASCIFLVMALWTVAPFRSDRNRLVCRRDVTVNCCQEEWTHETTTRQCRDAESITRKNIWLNVLRACWRNLSELGIRASSITEAPIEP